MTVVIKLGGHALDRVDAEAPRLVELAADVRALRDEAVLIVHGGGPQIAELSDRLGVSSHFTDGLRVTDAETMRVVAWALSEVNLAVTSALVHAGLPAVGLAGVSGGVVRGAPAGPVWGRTAQGVAVEPAALVALVGASWIPVISPIALASDGGVVNANADTVAGAIAGALGARALFLLSDVEQLRADPDDPASALAHVTGADITRMLASGAIRDGMRPKARAALDAVRAGARRVVVGDGTRPHALRELLAGQGPSTEVVA